MERVVRAARLSALTVLAVSLGACATLPARRGAPAAAIHEVVQANLVSEGYQCEASADLSWYSCTHKELTDLNFAYLGNSNLLQVWSVFTREDEALTPKWRAGSCDGVSADVVKMNAELVTKIVCNEKSYHFELSTWVPENGLSGDDVHAFVNTFRTIIGESIRGRGFLVETGAAAGPDAAARSGDGADAQPAGGAGI